MDEMKESRHRAFSLVELLVVIAIMALLIAAAVPALSSVAQGSNLNRAGQMLGDQIAQARLTAVSRNREIQVRFYQLTNGLDTGWRGLQVWRIEQSATGSIGVPASRLMVLPEGVIVEPDRSPLLDADATVLGADILPSRGSVNYQGFRFRPNGAMSAGVSASNNYLTLRPVRDSGANYYTVQVDPLTGKTTVYRP
jgi:uncharacterized protein (TIGR02596 family)